MTKSKEGCSHEWIYGSNETHKTEYRACKKCDKYQIRIPNWIDEPRLVMP